MALIERVFLGWDRPLLPLAAEFLIERYQSAGVVDLRDLRVVLPGARAGRRLREVLAGLAAQRGLRLVPPAVATTGRLPELLYTSEFPPGDSLLLSRVWAGVLRMAEPELLSILFGPPPAGDDPVGWTRLGGRVAALQHEVSAGGHTFAEVARAFAGVGDLLYDDSERWQALAALQRAYAERLRAVSAGDPDLERIERVRADLPLPSPELWLVGVTELPPVARHLVNLAEGSIGALIHAPADAAEGFDAIGAVLPQFWSARPAPLEAGIVRLVDGPGDQAAAILEEAAALGALRAGDLVVGHTSAELVPYLDEALTAAGSSGHDAAGTPIALTAPYRLLEAFAGYLDGRRWEHLAALVRHSDFGRWSARLRDQGVAAVTPEALDEIFAEHLPALARSFGDGGSAHLRERVLGLDASLFRELEGRRELRAWGGRIADLLIAIYAARPLLRDRASDRGTIEALRRIRSAILRMQRLPAEVDEMCDAPQAIRILLEGVRSEVVPEEPEESAIELLGWLELAADDAPHALVAGVNEGNLPQSLNADAFLPDSLRTRLGLPNNASRFGRDVFLLTTLIHSRHTLRLVAGRLSATGDPLRISRLLLMDEGEALAAKVLSYLGPAESQRIREPPLVGLAGTSSRLSLPPEPVLRFDPPTEISVTGFRPFLEDPYRYVLDRVLRLKRVGDQAREMDPLLFGTFAHAVLARFGRSSAARSTDERAVRAVLETLFAEEARRRFGDATFPAVAVQLEQLRARLAAFVDWQVRHVQEGWRITMVEGDLVDADHRKELDSEVYRVDTVELTVDGQPILLRGRIDRIDHHPGSGRWALLDYKTSDRPDTPTEVHGGMGGRPWKDLQLPLYRHLAAGIRLPDGRPLIPPRAEVELGYIVLSRAIDRVGLQLAPWGPADLVRADEEFARVVRALRTGVVRFDPDRRAGWPGDPLEALLGLRQLLAAEEDEPVLLEEVEA